MIRTLDAIILAGIAASIGIGSCVSCSARPAEAQSRPRPRAEDVRDVARCLVAEDERGDDWPSILDVLERRATARSMSTGAMARAYCAALRSTAPSARQARIRALPEGRPSARLARVWRAALEAALAGGPGTCLADHWGAPTGEDHERAVRAGWVRVDGCGARNAFWSLPVTR